jgi:hypothetical protein
MIPSPHGGLNNGYSAPRDNMLPIGSRHPTDVLYNNPKPTDACSVGFGLWQGIRQTATCAGGQFGKYSERLPAVAVEPSSVPSISSERQAFRIQDYGFN